MPSDLQIYAVTPIPESQDVLQRDGVPDNIKSFYKFNHIWRFRYDRPFHKGTKDKENEFKVRGGGEFTRKKDDDEDRQLLTRKAQKLDTYYIKGSVTDISLLLCIFISSSLYEFVNFVEMSF